MISFLRRLQRRRCLLEFADGGIVARLRNDAFIAQPAITFLIAPGKLQRGLRALHVCQRFLDVFGAGTI